MVAGGVKHALVSATILGCGGRSAQSRPRGGDEPLGTITAKADQCLSAPFFAKYYGTGDGARTDDPLHTVTVKERFSHIQADLEVPPFTKLHEKRARQVAEFLHDHGVWDGGEFVTLDIEGATYVIVDIGLRMLTPRELFNAQGFPHDYVIDGRWHPTEDEDGNPDFEWEAFPKSVQVSACGNSVPPEVAAALIKANCEHLIVETKEGATEC